jgi:hypothetical protein
MRHGTLVIWCCRLISQILTHSPHAYQRLETMELSPHSDLTSSKADVEAIEAANIEQAAGPERVVPTGRHRDKAAELLDSVPARIILTAAGRIIVAFYENFIWSFFLFCLPFIFSKPSTRQHWHTHQCLD